jgi:ATP-dependent helicase/nuclease subunit A
MKDFVDSRDRELAAATFDRNVIVTAGAGTGKTTLLIDRLTHLLVRFPEPLKVTEIVALTFTNKAADEMKSRLRERLQALLSVNLDQDPSGESESKIRSELKLLMERYHRTKDQIDVLAREALRNVERSAIGTIHSFAATLLRLYPIEAGLDPRFREDDGSRFEQLFQEQWALWLDQELARDGERKDRWKQVLRRLTLEELRELAFCLGSETVPLEGLSESANASGIPDSIARWLKDIESEGRGLIENHPGDTRLIAALSRAALAVIQETLGRGRVENGSLQEEKTLLETKGVNAVQGWSAEEVRQAKDLARIARRLVHVDTELFQRLCDLLVPFIRRCREALVSQGFVSFDGLLVRARDLVRDHPEVREELKRQFKAILIDEFQDTDPIQYEILLYLGEQIGRSARRWENVKLAQGKLFIVGDPKQSIYAFRRADIEAYLHVVHKMIERQGGVEYKLITNFRSHAAILDVVNGIFERIIEPSAGLQPPYVAIHSSAGADDPPANGSLPFRQVLLRKVACDDTPSADIARRMEAESLARWLDEEVIEKATFIDRDGKRALVQPRDIALLLRKLTDVHLYLEPLRRRGIPYVVEGERHFFAAQEIIDAVNLLRAVDNPYDRTALVGILRSAVGGLQDKEIYDLHCRRLLDYRLVNPTLPPSVQELYGALRDLRTQTRKLPVGEAVSLIFSRIPVRILAARSFNGEQAVANLEKIRQMAERTGREGCSTMKEVIARLRQSILDLKEEGESALAEESVDAVRILSVHKAKGLEFPVVVLAGSHAAVDQREPRTGAQHDWSSNLIGLNVADCWNLAGVFLAEKARLRSLEEQKRVFYVAMTRAREHLTISCGPTGKPTNGCFLGLLANALGDVAAEKSSGFIPAGKGRIESRAVREELLPPKLAKRRSDAKPPSFDLQSYVRFWEKRKAEYEKISQRPLFATPTSLKLRERELAESFVAREASDASDRALLIGTLAHRFLQQWDFASDSGDFLDQLARFLERWPDGRLGADRNAVSAELGEIFRVFFSSPAYAELRSTRILGRETPLLMPWDGQIMEGVIDLIYEKEGKLYLADYKTDRVEKKDLPRLAATYRLQAQIYSEAARKSLARHVAGFKLLFLRLGEGFDIALDRHSIQGSLPF